MSPLLSFSGYLEGEGLSFGLSAELLEAMGKRTARGEGCASMLSDPALAAAGLAPIHLLGIRRAWRRYRALEEVCQGLSGSFRDRVGPAAERWAARHAKAKGDRQTLAGSFAAAARATLKHGRLRMHATRPDDPRTQEVSSLVEHTEGCDDIPPHRWFTASRAVASGLVWIEVIPPEGEAAKCLGPAARPALVEDLNRSLAKAVLDAIGERAEREAIRTAADSLGALLSRPALEGPVAGVLVDAKHLFVHILGGEHDGQGAAFGPRDLQGLCAWLERREVSQVGVAQPGRRGSLAPLLKTLTEKGIMVEPVREAGLMKQARKRPGPIKPAAAQVVAGRIKDPLAGYAGLEMDELGLGEYLDRVDAARLQAALQDAREVAAWEREHGKRSAPTLRGMTTSPMVMGLDDLRPGMELVGTVANLTHFGAFVELGLTTQGLVHLSELADRFVKHPSEVVRVGDRVRVRVLEVDPDKNRVSLSMRSERKDLRKAPRDRRARAIKALDDLFKK